MKMAIYTVVLVSKRQTTYRQSSRGKYKDKDKAGLYSVCACLKKTKGETKVKLKGKYKDKDKILHIYTLVLVLQKG